MTEEVIYFGLAMFLAGAIVEAILRSALARQDRAFVEYLKMRVRRYEKDEMEIIERWEAYKKDHHTSEKEDSDQKGE